MSKRKTLVKEKIIDPEEEAKIKEELYSPVTQLFKENNHFSDDQIDQITRLMQNIEIFKTWCPENSTMFEFTRLICQNLQFETCQKDKAVFHCGEKGDKFYIILSGKVGVYIRRQAQQIEAEENAMLPKIEKMLEKMELKSIQDIPKDNLLTFYEKIIKKQSKPVKQIEIELQLLKTGNFDMYFTENGICKFQQYTVLHSGLYFGEGALTNDKPRAASIIVTQDLNALSLNKENFKKIFESQIKTQQEKIDYFLKMFPQMTKFKMSQLIMYFTQFKYPANTYIWKQDDPVDGLFLLKEGEIVLQQQFDIQNIIKQSQIEQQFQLSPKNNKKNYKENVTIANLTDGCFVGETDIFQQNEKREFTIKSNTICNVFVLHQDNFSIVKKSFPEFILPLSILQQNNLFLYQKRIKEIINTKLQSITFQQKEDNSGIERRYISELDPQSQKIQIFNQSIQPIIRSSMQPKLSKQKMVEQNQTIADIHTKSDLAEGKIEEFNMLKMAGENFQKCLLIRVEKQFEKFQPSKPKAKTPYFSKHRKDIKDLLEQIKRHQLPQVNSPSQNEPTFQSQPNEEDIITSLPFLTMTKPQLRIINPLVQQKVEILKQCLSRQSHSTMSKSKSVSQTVDQFYKTKAQQGFILCDSLFPYKPVHSTKNSLNKHYSNHKVISRNKTTQQSQNQKISCPDITDTNFFSSQPSVQF